MTASHTREGSGTESHLAHLFEFAHHHFFGRHVASAPHHGLQLREHARKLVLERQHLNKWRKKTE